MKPILPIFLAATMIGSADAASSKMPSYLCVADKATGFKYEGNQWRSVNFNVAQKKYTLSVPIGKTDYQWKEFGFSSGYSCEYFTDLIRCNGNGLGTKDTHDVVTVIGEDIVMFPNNLEYRVVFMGFPGKETTPYVEMGRCSQL